jgi:hypothetical protein
VRSIWLIKGDSLTGKALPLLSGSRNTNTVKLRGEVEEYLPIPGISEAYGHHYGRVDADNSQRRNCACACVKYHVQETPRR